MLRYNVIIEPDPESGGFWARVPELDGVFAQGETEEECLAEAKEAVEEFLAYKREQGQKIFQIEIAA